MSVLFILLLSLFVYILINSQGSIEQFTDKNSKPLVNSLAEKIFVDIGGVNQGMIIRSKNLDNPILLYIHGGPCFPNYFLIDKYKPGLEDIFTVCYWEQRGGGLSYNSEIPISSLNLEQLASDANELAKYLAKRFGKQKIYIMAHSGGTSFAIKAVQKAPELYYAYIAMAQITNQIESERIAYKFMLDTYSNQGSRDVVDKLKKYDVLETDSAVYDFFQSSLRDQLMHELHIGTMRNMNSIFRDVFLPVWTCNAYTIKEKMNIWISKFSFVRKSGLNKEILNTNFSKKYPEIKVPIYFISGKYDYTVNIDLSRNYYQSIQAPIKGFYTFQKSAHSPLYEESEKLKHIIINDVLKLKNDLADKQ